MRYERVVAAFKKSFGLQPREVAARTAALPHDSLHAIFPEMKTQDDNFIALSFNEGAYPFIYFIVSDEIIDETTIAPLRFERQNFPNFRPGQFEVFGIRNNTKHGWPCTVEKATKDVEKPKSAIISLERAIADLHAPAWHAFKNDLTARHPDSEILPFMNTLGKVLFLAESFDPSKSLRW